MDHHFSLTLFEALKRASFFLDSNGLNGTDAEYYYQYFKKWSLTDLVTHLHQPIDPQEWIDFQVILEKLAQHWPIQYLTGEAEFMGDWFDVSSDTLIPREETAGLVEMASDFLRSMPDGQIIDIGTGTGIIAIQLKRRFPNLTVWASDISPQALAVARKNAQRYNVFIHFVESDVLDAIPMDCTFDMILSNPPYIAKTERKEMDQSVLLYEPKQALFADQNGLSFYQRIAKDSPNYLKPNGKLLFEIGYQQGASVRAIMEAQHPNKNVTVKKDFNELDRYVIVD